MDIRPKWYYSIPSVIFSLILLGPFAFPLLWKSPAFNWFWKILITAVVCVATYFMLAGTVKIVQYVLHEFSAMQEAMNV